MKLSSRCSVLCYHFLEVLEILSIQGLGYAGDMSRLFQKYHKSACILPRPNHAMGHVHEYPTMHYLPRHTQSMIAHIILTEYFKKFQ